MLGIKKFLTIFLTVSFTAWNFTFLGVVYCLILPFIGVDLVVAIFNGEIEPEFLLAFLGLIITPPFCTYIGYRYFYRQPGKLARLFYGVEAPLFLLSLIRLFVLRELTPATHLILITCFVSIITLLIQLFGGYNQENKTISWLQAISHSLMLVFGVYFSLVLLFDVIPLGVYFVEFIVEFVRWVFTFEWIERVIYLLHPLSLLFLGFFILSCSLLVVMPFAVAVFYVSSANNILQAFGRQYSYKRAWQVLLGVTTAWLVLFTSFIHQPQVVAFDLLKEPTSSVESRATLVTKHSEDIRKGLVNAYLYSYRYISSVADSNRMRIMYRDALRLPETACQRIQDSYNWLISPFLYQGKRQDDAKAAKLYAEFFDTPIQKGEKKAVRHALKSTAILDDAKAGVLNIDQKKVWLKKQAVNIQEHGAWADVELYEVYENQTFDVEEIFYYFSLPENAVITGIWLGDNDKLATRFPFKVATRGAAQKVYNSQVRRVRPVDPALLEQVGSRQYRLRAFPVPPKLRSREIGNPQNRPTQMHLWLTYKVMQKDGQWELPHLEEQRNIYWTRNTQRLRNGKQVKGFREWLESSVSATQISNEIPTVNLLDSYTITAQPVTAKTSKLPQGKNLALILDTSYSMREQSKQLTKTLTWLRDNITKQNQVDVYLTYAKGIQSERMPFTQWVEKLQFNKNSNLTNLFYGTLQPKEMLQKFSELKAETKYDGIIILTDEGSYELGKDKQKLPDLNAPLWMVHLNSLAQAYDDATFKTIEKHGGGVTTNISEALQQIAVDNEPNSNIVRVAGGYSWSMFKNKSAVNDTQENSFTPLGARVLVRELSKEIVDNNLAQLDAIHAIAKQYKIVTPYSSMIVLVNDEQRKALQKAESQKDRFDRKIEDGKETLNKPNNPLNNSSASIPEPSNIIALMVVVLSLLLTRWQRIKSFFLNSNKSMS